MLQRAPKKNPHVFYRLDTGFAPRNSTSCWILSILLRLVLVSQWGSCCVLGLSDTCIYRFWYVLHRLHDVLLWAVRAFVNDTFVVVCKLFFADVITTHVNLLRNRPRLSGRTVDS